MKRSIKAVMALLTAVTMTAGSIGVTAYAEETQAAVETAPRTQTGTFKDGASYTFVPSSGALIIGGEGTFTTEEFDSLTKSLEPTVVIFGKQVKMPKNKKAANEWICSLLKMSSGFTVLTFKGSDLEKRRAEMLNALAAEAVKAGKKADASTFSDAFYLYEVDGYIDSEEEAIEKFDFPDAVVEKGEKQVNELVEKGIRESIARKIAAFYCYGLYGRIRSFWAYPDGREVNKKTEDYYTEKLYNTAKSEQDVIDNTDEENLTFDNAISDFLSENGFAQSEVYNITRLYAIGSKLSMAFEMFTFTEERPHELYMAYRKDYESKFIAPDLTDIDMVLEYRGKWMRDYLEDFNFSDEIVEEVIADYLTGLKIRIDEGLAQPNGEEINEETRNEFMRICNRLCHAKRDLENESNNEKSAAYYEKMYRNNRKLLLSDYTLNTEDSKTKYINVNGDYVKFEIFAGNDGVLESGIEYHYNPENKALFLDGDGALTDKDEADLGKNFDFDILIAGKNVVPGDDLLWATYDKDEKDRFSMWVEMYCNTTGLLKLYTYADSKIKKIYDENINLRIKYAEGCTYGGGIEDHCTDRAKLEEYFPIHIIGEDEDPYELLKNLEGIDKENNNVSAKKAVPETAKSTLKGDADVNGEVSLSDIVAVSKFNLSDTAYPLKNETALANADMNSDKQIDTRDTSALIEVNLS